MTPASLPLAAVRSGISEAHLSAMGSAVHVMTVGGRPSFVQDAVRRIEALERSWSRFRTDSELSVLNASRGEPVVVSDDLFTALTRASDAVEMTSGSYDPTVIDALERAGYDRSFELVEPEGPRSTAERARAGPAIELEPSTRTVRLLGGARIDLGGIGKGLAADLVITELFRLGVDGALVNIGGDLRVAGTAPSPDGWVIEIEDPFHRRERGFLIALADGAVATSSTREKAWKRDGKRMHHLIDPRTLEPVVTSVVTATVVGAEAWRAEALTKAIFVLGVDAGLDLVESNDGHALVFLEDGRSVAGGRWSEIAA